MEWGGGCYANQSRFTVVLSLKFRIRSINQQVVLRRQAIHSETLSYARTKMTGDKTA
jgi:hypothetical protein